MALGTGDFGPPPEKFGDLGSSCDSSGVHPVPSNDKASFVDCPMSRHHIEITYCVRRKTRDEQRSEEEGAEKTGLAQTKRSRQVT